VLVANRLQLASQTYIIAADQVPRRAPSLEKKVLKNSELEWNSLRWLGLAWALHLYTHDSLKVLFGRFMKSVTRHLVGMAG